MGMKSMSEFTIILQWEWIIGLGIPAVAAAGGIIRYFWKKEQCFVKMANKIKALDEHDVSSVSTHGDFDNRLKNLEDDAIEIKIYLRQLLTKMDIPYK